MTISVFDLSSYFMARITRSKATSDAEPGEVACMSIARIANELDAHAEVVVALDGDGPSWRTKLISGYRTRKERARLEDDQIRSIESIVADMGLPVVRARGLEADDIAALVVREIISKGGRAVIVSSSPRLLPLTERGVTLREPFGSARDASWCRNRFGVWPSQIPDFLALTGKAGTPGLPGIGEKRAQELIRRWHSLERLLASDASAGRFEKRIQEHGLSVMLGKAISSPYGWRLDQRPSDAF